jgi:purine-binding chemotaxis protein CheW
MTAMSAMGENVIEYVTATIGGQLFGLPIGRVQDVFMPERLTRVPLAATEVAGLLNLRGRIVTVIDMRRRLDFEDRAADGAKRGPLALGIEHREGNPVNLDPRLARVSAGVHRLDGRLLVVLDVERVLDAAPSAQAA